MKSLLFALILLLAAPLAQAQVYVGDEGSTGGGPPPVYYRDGKPYVPGYNGNYPNTPRGQANTVEVGRPYYPYYGYPGYGYGPAAYSNENTVVVGQPYYGYPGYGYGPTAYPDDNTVVVGQPYYGYGSYGYGGSGVYGY